MPNTENMKNALGEAKPGARNNNFAMLRMIATVFVFAGHMGMIIDGIPPVLGNFRLHELGVETLFLLSGYLITMSWLSDPHPLRYGIRRFFRLWPPFVVMVLIMVFIAGPLVSDLGPAGYFQSWYQTYLLNLRFFIIYAQPGVFADMTVAYTTNGSLWTMPVEAALYVVTPVLLTLLRVRRCPDVSFVLTAVLTGAMVLSDLYLRVFCPGASVVFYATDLVSAYHLVTMYMIGIFFTYEKARKHLHLDTACIAVCLLLVFQRTSEVFWQYLMLYLVLPYFVFSFAFAPGARFRGFCRKLEPSYGIYLYGFFFQQLTVYLLQKNAVSFSYAQAFVLSAIPTLAAAVLSCYLIEKPSLRLGRYLSGKLRKRSG